MPRLLDGFENAALEAINRHCGCNILDLRVLLGRSAVYDLLRPLLKSGIVIKKRFRGENFNRYYAFSKHPPGSRLKKRKPILDDSQTKILQVVKRHPGFTGWEIREFTGGIAVSNFYNLPLLIRRGLVRMEKDVPFSRYYPI